MDIPKHPPMRVEITFGEIRNTLDIEAELLGEGREADLQEKLSATLAQVKWMARKAGLRPHDDAFMEALMAFNEATERGDRAEANRLRTVMESLHRT